MGGSGDDRRCANPAFARKCCTDGGTTSAKGERSVVGTILAKERDPMNDSERVVVVGTGPAGAAAAIILGNAGFSPLLLEAGSGNVHLGLTARIHGLTFAKIKSRVRQREDLTMTNGACELFEELAPGGLSNHWACAVPRFSRDDFADAARAGQEYTWPIGYDDLVPWYERLEPLMQIAGECRDAPHLPSGRVRRVTALDREWEAVARGLSVSGRGVVAMPYAFGQESTITRAGTPFNAYKRLVAPRERTGELGVTYDVQVLRLEYSAASRRVTAVLGCNPKTGAKTRIPCRAVVLAAGAVNSAQILLESKSADFPTGLGNSCGLVGKYMHDHPLGKLVIDTGHMVKTSVAAYITRPSLDRSKPLYAAACMQWGGTAAIARALLRGGKADWVGFSVFGTMIPTKDDGIALEESVTNGTRARLRYALRYPRDAVVELERTRDEVMAALERAGWEPRERLFLVEKPGNSVHYGGTCRMHASPRFGVVNAFSRMHDVKNVVVADSAVFTTGPEKNPVLTAMAIGARATDHLARDLRQGDV
jgi:choline dehydrogenase-like flavoprotein